MHHHPFFLSIRYADRFEKDVKEIKAKINDIYDEIIKLKEK